MRELKIEVAEVKQRCGARHKVGDSFYIRGGGTIEIPAGRRICIYALNSLFPFLTAKQREDELPDDDWISETEYLTCPDPKGVVFRVTPLAYEFIERGLKSSSQKPYYSDKIYVIYRDIILMCPGLSCGYSS